MGDKEDTETIYTMSKATLLLLLVFLVVVADSILYIFMSSGIRITFLCTDKASNIIDYQTTPDQWTPPHNLYILEQQFLYITCGLLDVCSLQGWNAICDLASGEKAHFQSTGWVLFVVKQLDTCWLAFLCKPTLITACCNLAADCCQGWENASAFQPVPCIPITWNNGIKVVAAKMKPLKTWEHNICGYNLCSVCLRGRRFLSY